MAPPCTTPPSPRRRPATAGVGPETRPHSKYGRRVAHRAGVSLAAFLMWDWFSAGRWYRQMTTCEPHRGIAAKSRRIHFVAPAVAPGAGRHLVRAEAHVAGLTAQSWESSVSADRRLGETGNRHEKACRGSLPVRTWRHVIHQGSISLPIKPRHESPLSRQRVRRGVSGPAGAGENRRKRRCPATAARLCRALGSSGPPRRHWIAAAFCCHDCAATGD